MPGYRIEISATYMAEHFNARRDHGSKRIGRVVLKALCILLLTALAVGLFLVNRKTYPVDLLFLALALLVMVSHKFDQWLFLRQSRKSPFFNQLVAAHLDENGYRESCSAGASELPWQSFSGYSRRTSGFLVFMEPGITHWWPDKALQEGSVADVEALLSKSIKR